MSVTVASFYPGSADPQSPADVAVMMVTVLRPSVVSAIRSVYRQTFAGSIQLLIGIDVARGPLELLTSVLAERPEHVSILVFQLPYSTAVRNGGLHAPNDGGALRNILAAAANARYLAQLDDDNEWLPNHISGLRGAIEGVTWAFTRRILVDELTDIDLAIDVWDSVGPDRGRMAEQGGFVDPNCLMIDKIRFAPQLGCYGATPDGAPGWGSDRLVFSRLCRAPHREVTEATVRYRVRRNHWVWRPLIALKKQGLLKEFGWSLQSVAQG